MKTTLTLFAYFIAIQLHAQYNSNEQRSVCQHILNGHTDSARYYAKRLAPNPNTTAIQNIIADKVTYPNMLKFITIANINNKQDLIKLNTVIKKYIPEPTNKEYVDIDYVKIKSQQTQSMINQAMLDEALVTNTLLKKYINKFLNNADENTVRATIYASNYDIVVAGIQNNYKKVNQIALDNEQKAVQLKDTALIICSKYFNSEYLVQVKDLDGYINNCQTIISLENKLVAKTEFYVPTVQQLIDASIFKGNFDETYIEQLLYNNYTNPNYKYESYILYTKLLGALPKNSLIKQKIFKQFGANNYESFCDTVISRAKEKVNTNELMNLYEQCAKLLFKCKLYDVSNSYRIEYNVLLKKLYSQELAQNIGDSQTRDVEQVNALKREKLQAAIDKQKTIIWIISIALTVFSVLCWFLYTLLKQRNTLNKQLAFANNDLKRLNTLNQKIFSVISHDFKTPMLTLSMLVNGFKKKNTDATVTEHIAEVSNQFNNANTILTNLINWAKTEINIAHTNAYTTCNVNEIATEITTQLQPLAQHKHITFVCNISQNDTAHLPADILRIVLRNLLSNAIKFSPENAVVHIVFNAELNILQVIDVGVGIPEQKVNLLFKTDVVSNFGTQHEPGFGIGLYIVHELLHKYKCSIAVVSQLQHGSTFTVTIPCTKV